ncbi:tetraacyldisaccharide 4'-kinase [Asticcacaulis sp. 201]|uniref:tetraacyldisaccharide 4'-kinase n=1 Tax=Asticcacaulis sp. 201 TaxID=3028787 RepID=UPI0029168A37|nr:tetraacyldisaccharide 4'-kinase [Asticcacaulis sp. 201]MDV6332989.1 tetraacyldisaccharide 4'-kinase [Asticcacaulis sp. 201]
MIRTPDWWYKKGAAGAPWWRPILWPLSLVWRAVNAVKRAKAKPYRSSLFVISIGNLTLGGSGKTPIADELLTLLAPDAWGLSRGHGGSLAGPVRVDPATHTAAEVGDEPLMLAQNHPFVIATDRAAGLRLIEQVRKQPKPTIVVVDDAHQNLRIAKDLHILVIDGDTRNGAWPFGDGGVCPYGPMREPLREGLARADMCVLWMPDDDAQPDDALISLLGDIPVFVARLQAHAPAIPAPVFGFAAIAKPWKFEITLRNEGYDVAGFAGFPDHAALSDTDLERLAARALASDARLITTQKDWVKLDVGWRERVASLPITAKFDDEPGLVAAVMDAVARRNRRS